MKRIKSVAMYLPQFHRLPENDKWWGEGFTEWTTVKAAEKLYEGHNQKREPLGDHYYDLMKKETMLWQAELAEKYGIDGFCFYHYYFSSERKILEKPAENLLKWKEIPMHFCFCWANETWARTWSNLSANGWSEKFETQNQNGSGILLEQSYGDENAWKKHFEYLYPFFEDDRYIKMNNKPVFLFYKPEDISVLNSMLEEWSKRIQEKGYDGIYAIGINSSMNGETGLDAVLLQGPIAYRAPNIAGMTVREEWRNGVKTYAYEKIWENALESQKAFGMKTYFGGFVDYDDTPRRGRLGMCMTGVTPQAFERNLFDLAVKNVAAGNEFLFLNAWNEWGEGNYLEPDKKNGFQYLEAVRRVMRKVNQDDFDAIQEWDKICTKRAIFKNRTDDEKTEKQALLKELNKFRSYYKLLDRWLLLKEQGKRLDCFFKNHGYKKIVIYGFAALGKHLYEELADSSSVSVVGAMDRRRGLFYGDIVICSLEDELPECDAIIVTAVAESEEITRMLKRKTEKPIISLQEVVFYAG